MTQEQHNNSDWFNAQRVVPAIVLIAVGGIFLLSNLHLLHIRDIWQYWPVVLMVAGVFKLADADDARERTGGGLLLAFGSIFLANNMGLISFNVWDLWPLLLIGLGVYLLVDRVGASARSDGKSFQSPAGNPARGPYTAREAVIFSGGKRKIAVDNFVSAKYECIFGGYEIDLRGSQIQGESAVLELNCIFGGAEVKIPRNWSVIMKGVGVFGAFVDSAEQPDPSVVLNIKRLVVRGGAIFGGVEIKN
jgi:hypothetical protein